MSTIDLYQTLTTGNREVLTIKGVEYPLRWCRSAYRGSGKPSNRFNDLGFRLALVSESE